MNVVLLLAFGTIYVLRLSSRKPISPSLKPLSSPAPLSPTLPKPLLTHLQLITLVEETSLTATWKKYTNGRYNFSIKYPHNKKVEIEEKDTEVNNCNKQKSVVDIKLYPLDYVKSEFETHFTGELWISISIVNTENTISVEDYLRKNCSYLFSENKIASIQPIQIEDMTGLRVNYKNVMAEQMEAVITKDKKMYFVHGFSYELQNLLYDQILSTFKFIEQKDQTVCTADVKECPDGSYVSRQPPNCEFAKCP